MGLDDVPLGPNLFFTAYIIKSPSKAASIPLVPDGHPAHDFPVAAIQHKRHPHFFAVVA